MSGQGVRRAAPGAVDDEALTRLGIALIGTALGACGLVSAAGAVASFVSGGGWRVTPFADTGPALVGLARDPGQPAAAYPEQVAAGLPGPLLYWTTVVVLLSGVVGVATVVAVLWWRRFGVAAPDRASWAGARDERRITVPDDPAGRPWRLVAGRATRTRRLVAAEDCISAVAFGPNGSGKSTGLIVPNVLEWDGPVVMTTTKPQDVNLVLARRRALGPVWVVAPAGCPGIDTACWSPVAYATDGESADRMAEWLCEASGLAADVRSRAWVLQARKLIKPLLLAANTSGGGIEAFVRWIYDGRAAAEEVKAILGDSGLAEARREYGSTWSIHEEGIGSVLFTAYGLADVYSRPSVLATAARSDFTAADLLCGGAATLVVVAPESDADRFAPLLTALIASVVHEAEQQAARRGGPVEPRLLLALDEAANVFRFPRLPALLTTARGNGIQLLLAYHDLGQLEHVTGSKEVARTVVSNAKLRILLPGVGDLGTLRYFSDLLGRTRVRQDSVTRGAGGSRSTSTSEGHDDLAPLHTLRQLPDGHAIVAYQNLPPMRVRLRFCYADKALRRLAAGGPTELASEVEAATSSPAATSPAKSLRSRVRA